MFILPSLPSVEIGFNSLDLSRRSEFARPGWRGVLLTCCEGETGGAAGLDWGSVGLASGAMLGEPTRKDCFLRIQ